MNKQDIIHTKYFHIDNGGFTFSVGKDGTIEIDFGFYGYANTVVTLPASNWKTEFNSKVLAEFFTEANFKLSQIEAE